MARRDPPERKTVGLTAAARRYGEQFASLRATGFSAFSGATRNEWGLFLSGFWKPARRIRIDADVDRHRWLLGEEIEELPDRGMKTALYVSHPFAGNRLRWTWTVSGRLEQGTLSKERRRVRLKMQRRMDPLRIGVWSERSKAHAGAHSDGLAFGADAAIARDRLKTSVWMAGFNTSSYDSRIYTFEPDVWGGPLLLALHGKGWPGGIRSIAKVGPAEIAVRYSLRSNGGRTRSGWALQIEVER